MYRHAVTALSDAAVSYRLAGRLDLFFFRGCAHGVLGAPHPPFGGIGREPVSDRFALDWNCLRCRLPGDFNAVFSLACGIGTAARSPSHSALCHARTDTDFTIRYFAQMAALRVSMPETNSVVATDPVRVQFNALHAWSTRLEGGVLLLGLVVVYLTAQQLSGG
jgi:hypothetical protein